MGANSRSCLLVVISAINSMGHHPHEFFGRLEVIELGTGFKVLAAVDHNEYNGSEVIGDVEEVSVPVCC